MNDSDGSHSIKQDNSEDPLPRRFTPMAGLTSERQISLQGILQSMVQSLLLQDKETGF
jgi:hypothetical protein